MTDSGDENDNNLHKLPLSGNARPPAPPHKFGALRQVLPSESLTGLPQLERTCLNCGLVKITVMGPPNPRAYRWGDAPFQFDDGFEPECVVVADVKEGRVA